MIRTHVAVGAAVAAGGITVCRASPQGAMAALTHQALRLTPGTGCQWRCQWMSPSALTECTGKRNPAAQPSAMVALALTVAAKGGLKMTLRMMVKILEIQSDF